MKRRRRLAISLVGAVLIFGLGVSALGQEAAAGSDEFVAIPAGVFMMGSPLDEAGRYEDEALHEVTLSRSYLMGRDEVSWSLWNEVRDWAISRGYTDIVKGNNGFSGSEEGDHPVTDVSWWDAIYWCNARSEREGLAPVYYRSENFGTKSVIRSGLGQVYANWEAEGYRLPSEAEWENACRAGARSAFYSGTNLISEADCRDDENLSLVAWYCANSDRNTHPSGTKPANGFGLSDMHGNAFEWCWDWYGPYEEGRLQENPTGPESGVQRVQRGGSWMNTAIQARSAYRHPLAPSTLFYNAGFRLARSNGE